MPRPKKIKTKEVIARLEKVDENFEKSSDYLSEKLKTMTQTDGRDETVVAKIEQVQKKTLDEVWNRKFSKFRVDDTEQYIKKLTNLTKLDLQQECIKVGLMPLDNRAKMIERLTKECNKHFAGVRTAGLQPIINIPSAASREILSRSGNSLI